MNASARRLPPNLLAIPFGLAGLANVWRAAVPALGAPGWCADVFALAAVAAMVVIGRSWLSGGLRGVRADWRDPVLTPFVALAPVCVLMLGSDLAVHAPWAGHAVQLAAVSVILVLGGVLSGRWVADELDLDALHPGYFLPTVAGGLLSAIGAAQAGAHGLAVMAFAIGMLTWLLVGGLILGRLLFRPPLTPVLTPTLAILVAPPAVGGLAWFALNGGRADAIALAFAGTTVFMVLVQLALVPVFRRLSFGPGFWSFTFSWAAVATYGIHWIELERPAAAAMWQWLLVAAATALVGAIAARSLLALRRGTFLPPVAAPRPAPAS